MRLEAEITLDEAGKYKSLSDADQKNTKLMNLL